MPEELLLGYGQGHETDLHSKTFRPNLKLNRPPIQYPGMILTIQRDLVKR